MRALLARWALLLAHTPAASALVPAGVPRREPNKQLLFSTAFLQSACFGVIGSALPTALMQQQQVAFGADAATAAARAAATLGRLASASALAEVLLAGNVGKLSDAVGRRPVLMASPALCVLARAV
eukprot:686591-Prymnesium_polylepis.1